MPDASSPSTLYYDGACPLCRAEIAHYRRADRRGALCFVDAAQPGAALPEGLSLQHALARFHVRAADGQMLSGAAAFVAVWARLPRWRWAARLARLPGMLAVLERGYLLFLPLRPTLSRIVGKLLRSQSDRCRKHA